MSVCAACPVLTGECPTCGTYYYVRGDGKRFGIFPVTTPQYRDGVYTRNGTAFPMSLSDVTNAFQQQPSPALVAAAEANVVRSMADSFRDARLSVQPTEKRP